MVIAFIAAALASVIYSFLFLATFFAYFDANAAAVLTLLIALYPLKRCRFFNLKPANNIGSLKIFNRILVLYIFIIGIRLHI